MGDSARIYITGPPLEAPPCPRPPPCTLLRAALAGEGAVVVLRGDCPEPLFSVIPQARSPALERAWQTGERSPQHWLRGLDPVTVACPTNDPRLANFNTPELLAARGQPLPRELGRSGSV